MKFAIAFASVLAVASAQFGSFRQQASRFVPQPVTKNPLPARPSVPVATRVSTSDQNANVIRNDNDIGPDGSFSYFVQLDNGISAQAQGTPRPLEGNPPVSPVVSQGSFSWTSPEGQPIAITYIANEYGYQPTGDVIPTSPPIPEAILKSIEFNAKNAQKK